MKEYDDATCNCMEEWYVQIDTLLACQIVYGRMVGRFNLAASAALGYPAGTEHFLGEPGVTEYVVPQYAIEVSIAQQPWNTPLQVCENQLEAGRAGIKTYQGFVHAMWLAENYFRALAGLPSTLPPTPPRID